MIKNSAGEKYNLTFVIVTFHQIAANLDILELAFARIESVLSHSLLHSAVPL